MGLYGVHTNERGGSCQCSFHFISCVFNPYPNPQIAFKRRTTINDLLVRTKLTPNSLRKIGQTSHSYKYFPQIPILKNMKLPNVRTQDANVALLLFAVPHIQTSITPQSSMSNQILILTATTLSTWFTAINVNYKMLVNPVGNWKNALITIDPILSAEKCNNCSPF